MHLIFLSSQCDVYGSVELYFSSTSYLSQQGGYVFLSVIYACHICAEKLISKTTDSCRLSNLDKACLGFLIMTGWSKVEICAFRNKTTVNMLKAILHFPSLN